MGGQSHPAQIPTDTATRTTAAATMTGGGTLLSVAVIMTVGGRVAPITGRDYVTVAVLVGGPIVGVHAYRLARELWQTRRR